MAKELRIHRPDLLVRDPLDQVVRFFGADPSSAGRNGYDAYVLSGRSPRNRVVDEDIVAINTTMGARSPHADWAKVIARGELRELRSVDPGWDLFLTSDKVWSRFAVPERIAALLKVVTGKGIGVSRATKVLHIKRPRLVPICDSYVLDLMGIPGEGVTRSVALIQHLRGLRHDLLPELRSLQKELRGRGYDRTLVRVADGLIWASHPDTWLTRRSPRPDLC